MILTVYQNGSFNLVTLVVPKKTVKMLFISLINLRFVARGVKINLSVEITQGSLKVKNDIAVNFPI